MHDYQEKINLLKSNNIKLWGGYEVPSLANYARAIYEIKKHNLKPTKIQPLQTQKIDTQTSITTDKKQTKLINQYPIQLHKYYNQKNSAFIEACSLKIQLNQLLPNQTKDALKIQRKIITLFETIDYADEYLKHWDKHKKILLSKTKTDKQKKLTTAEAILKRNNLRSLATNRKKTITKIEKQLLQTQEIKRPHLENKLQIKLNELNQILTQIKEFDIIINNNGNI